MELTEAKDILKKKMELLDLQQKGRLKVAYLDLDGLEQLRPATIQDVVNLDLSVLRLTEECRPYKNADEFWNENTCSWWVIEKSTGNKFQIIEVTQDYVGLGLKRVSLDELYKGFTFLDGSICGVKVDDRI